MDSLSLTDLRQWYLAMFDVEQMPKTIQRELIFWILDMCKRYGDDGMGDKPADVSTTLYWLQHLGEGGPNPHLWGRLMAAARDVKEPKEPKEPKEEPKPKKARAAKAKAKAAPKPPEEAASSSSGGR